LLILVYFSDKAVEVTESSDAADSTGVGGPSDIDGVGGSSDDNGVRGSSDEEEVSSAVVAGGSGGGSSSDSGGGGIGEAPKSRRASSEVASTPKAAQSKDQELLDFAPKASKFEASLLEPLSLLDVSTENIEAFGEEYSKLQHALRKSTESENRFINKCKTLIKQIRSSSHKLTALSSLHQTDIKKKDKYTEDIASNQANKQEASASMTAQRELIKGVQEVQR
jgi:hypothetical protein